MINFLIICALFLFESVSYASDIATEYGKLSKSFIASYMSDNYQASQIAFKQLSIDPSDSTALLRLSISMTDKQCSEIKSYYLELGSEDEIRDIARSIIRKTCQFK